MGMISMLLFGIPVRVNNELELLIVDDVTHGLSWQKFMRRMIASWKDTRHTTILLTM